MNCDPVRAALPAYLDQDLDARRRERVDAHLVDCPACRAELDGLRAAVAALRATPVPPAPRAHVDAVLAAVAADGGIRSGTGARADVAGRPVASGDGPAAVGVGPRRRWAWTGHLAAAALGAVATWAWLGGVGATGRTDGRALEGPGADGSDAWGPLEGGPVADRRADAPRDAGLRVALGPSVHDEPTADDAAAIALPGSAPIGSGPGPDVAGAPGRVPGPPAEPGGEAAAIDEAPDPSGSPRVDRDRLAARSGGATSTTTFLPVPVPVFVVGSPLHGRDPAATSTAPAGAPILAAALDRTASVLERWGHRFDTLSAGSDVIADRPDLDGAEALQSSEAIAADAVQSRAPSPPRPGGVLRVQRVDGRVRLELRGTLDEYVPALLARVDDPDAGVRAAVERRLEQVAEELGLDAPRSGAPSTAADWWRSGRSRAVDAVGDDGDPDRRSAWERWWAAARTVR